MPSGFWLLLSALGGLAIFLAYKRIDRNWLIKQGAKIIRSDERNARNAEIAKQNEEAIRKADEIVREAGEGNSKLTLDEKFEKLKRPIERK